MNEFMKNFSLEGKIAFVTGASCRADSSDDLSKMNDRQTKKQTILRVGYGFYKEAVLY